MLLCSKEIPFYKIIMGNLLFIIRKEIVTLSSRVKSATKKQVLPVFKKRSTLDLNIKVLSEYTNFFQIPGNVMVSIKMLFQRALLINYSKL